MKRKTAVNSDFTEPGLSVEEARLLNTPLPYDLKPDQMQELWASYQKTIEQFLLRLGAENKVLDHMARAMLVGSLDGVYARVALIPKLGWSALKSVNRHGVINSVYRLAGECTLMELSAAAGYRTFCFPDLIRGLVKTGKMKNRPVDRMMDTFDFLTTMFQQPLDDPHVIAHLERTNGLHKKYKVAGAFNERARDLFKYIALNMFYIGPRMRPDLSPAERHAICGLTVLVSRRMGHGLEGSVFELERFIDEYEATQMFERDDQSPLRKQAVAIAQASKSALDHFPTISPARVHGYVPHKVKKILEID